MGEKFVNETIKTSPFFYGDIYIVLAIEENHQTNVLKFKKSNWLWRSKECSFQIFSISNVSI